MLTLELTDREKDVLLKAITTCIEKCRQGGAEEGCSDCETLENILTKVNG